MIGKQNVFDTPGLLLVSVQETTQCPEHSTPNSALGKCEPCPKAWSPEALWDDGKGAGSYCKGYIGILLPQYRARQYNQHSQASMQCLANVLVRRRQLTIKTQMTLGTPMVRQVKYLKKQEPMLGLTDFEGYMSVIVLIMRASSNNLQFFGNPQIHVLTVRRVFSIQAG